MALARAVGWPLLVAALAAGLRLPGLAWLPNPAGDEGNWLSLGAELARGEPAQLIPEARFVSLAFAQLIALCFRLGESTAGYARLVTVVPVVVTAAIVAWTERRVATRPGFPWAGLVVALHPWAVFWSRTASVPYALSFAVAMVGACFGLIAVEKRSPAWLAVCISVVALGAQFSPLSIVSAVAVGAWLLARAPTLFWSPLPLLAIAVGFLHVAPVAVAALDLAGQVGPTPDGTGPADKLAGYLLGISSGLLGETTLRHVGGGALPLAQSFSIAAVFWVVALGLALRGLRCESSPLLGYGLLHLTLALCLAPLVLSAGRAWDLGRIDTDRYLFAHLPGFVCLLGGLARTADRRARYLVPAAVLVLGLGTARMAYSFLQGGCVDAGAVVRAGGECYRGFRTAESGPVLAQVASALRVDAAGRQGTVLVRDPAFKPLRLPLERTRLSYIDLNYWHVPDRTDRLYYTLTFAAGAFDSAHPSRASANARAMRNVRDREFRARQPLLRLRQPDGTPLVELDRVTGYRGPR